MLKIAYFNGKKFLSISLKLNFTPNNLGYYELTILWRRVPQTRNLKTCRLKELNQLKNCIRKITSFAVRKVEYACLKCGKNLSLISTTIGLFKKIHREFMIDPRFWQDVSGQSNRSGYAAPTQYPAPCTREKESCCNFVPVQQQQPSRIREKKCAGQKRAQAPPPNAQLHCQLAGRRSTAPLAQPWPRNLVSLFPPPLRCDVKHLHFLYHLGEGRGGGTADAPRFGVCPAL